jgi:hypothetical protein
MKHTRNIRLAMLCGLVAGAIGAHGQVFSQWDFDAGNLNATVGDALLFKDTDTQTGTKFGTTTALSLPSIGGSVATVMGFPRHRTGVETGSTHIL